MERLVFASEDEAKAAKARLDAGESFDALVEERGLKLMDIDLGDVSKAELGAAGDGVFALTAPGVAGPLPSDLGPALYRMNAVLAAQETTFEQAKADLTTEYQMDAARRAIADKVEAIDDALAGALRWRIWQKSRA
ncbi:peptidyl-prolyl cis-trans isomerase [Gemmobacter lanyuensis]